MQVQFNTGHNIEGSEALTARFTVVVEDALDRFRDRITRLEVHLSDENGQKSGHNDKRCMIEARLERHQPLAVTQHAATLDQAIVSAASKMSRLLESTLGRLRDQDSHDASRDMPGLP